MEKQQVFQKIVDGAQSSDGTWRYSFISEITPIFHWMNKNEMSMLTNSIITIILEENNELSRYKFAQMLSMLKQDGFDGVYDVIQARLPDIQSIKLLSSTYLSQATKRLLDNVIAKAPEPIIPKKKAVSLPPGPLSVFRKLSMN